MTPTKLQQSARDLLDRAEAATGNTYRPPAHVGLRVATLLGADELEEVFVDVVPAAGERNAYSGALVVFGTRTLVVVSLDGVPSRGANSPGGMAGTVSTSVLARGSLRAIRLGPVPPWVQNENEVWRDHESGWPLYASIELQYEGQTAPVVVTPPSHDGIREEFYAALVDDLTR